MKNKTIGIIFALDKEINEYLVSEPNVKKIKVENYNFYSCEVNDNQIVFTKSGVGKSAAAALTAILITQFHPDLIINSGVAGGVDKSLKICDIVIADKLIYSDVDMTTDITLNLKYGQMQDCPPYFEINSNLKKQIEDLNLNVKFGTIITGDQFVTKRDHLDFIVNNYFSSYHVLACDMESTAIAHICNLFNVQFLAIRAISDVVGNNNAIDFVKFLSDAAKKSTQITNEIIEKTNPWD